MRELRRASGLSQEALAERAEIHRNYVGSVERGERDVSVGVVDRMSAALGVSMSEFFLPFSRQKRR